MALVYVGSSFPAEAQSVLEAGLDGHAVVWAAHASGSNLVPGEVDPRIAEAEVVLGQPPVDAIVGATAPRWVHLTSAGYTRYAVPEVADRLRAAGVALTTSSSVYADPCATHALSLLLALVRRLDEAFEDQHGARTWPDAALRERSAVLSRMRVMVLGHGAIGRRLLELLAPFRPSLAVVREHPRGDESVVAWTRERALAELGAFDAVVSTLPETDTTRGFVGASWLAAMKPGALFVNVGRGATVDHSALVRALASGHLGGAALDVTDPEPLPPTHPLWTLRRCIVTPHMAGGQRGEHVELVRHFLSNLERFTDRRDLVDRVM